MKPTQQSIDKFRKTILDNTSEEHRKEILELKFGCKVKVNKSDVIYSIITMVSWQELSEYGKINTIDLVNDNDIFWCNSKYDKQDITEIIGRDLTLEDILLAIQRSHFSPNTLYAGGGTIDYRTQVEAKKIQAMRMWKPTLPSHLQEEETLLSIIKLFE